MTEPLCRHCDCFVGIGGAGVFHVPEGRDLVWQLSHCWGCGRDRDAVEADPYGRPSTTDSDPLVQWVGSIADSLQRTVRAPEDSPKARPVPGA